MTKLLTRSRCRRQRYLRSQNQSCIISWSNSWPHALKISVSLKWTSSFMAGGADMQNILTFEKDYKEARSFCWVKIIAPLNYPVSNNDVIKNHRHRRPKISDTKWRDGEEIVYYRLMMSRMKAFFGQVKTIEELSREAGYKHRVLYRTSHGPLKKRYSSNIPLHHKQSAVGRKLMSQLFDEVAHEIRDSRA